MDPVQVVRAGYDLIGEGYWEWSHESPVRVRNVERLLARLPHGSLVVELGCGPGDPATRMFAEHHRVIGVDISFAQLAIARRNAPTAALVQADISSLAMHSESIDAVASCYALGHIPQARHRPLFAEIARWLRPGGVLMTNAPLSPGDGIEQEWLGVPMFFGGIGEAATMTAIADAGLTIESAERVRESEDDERPEEFLWLVATKPG